MARLDLDRQGSGTAAWDVVPTPVLSGCPGMGIVDAKEHERLSQACVTSNPGTVTSVAASVKSNPTEAAAADLSRAMRSSA